MAADTGTSEETVARLAQIGIDQPALGAQSRNEGAGSFNASRKRLLASLAGGNERVS